MRTFPLTVMKGGINRLRTKGAVSANSLYDLVNGRLTDAGTVKCRPGTIRRATLASTKGLVAFQGTLHVFASSSVSVPTGYTLHILNKPNDEPGVVTALSRIHFAAPFMGFLYVVAEFEDGSIFHYWLRKSGTWQANTAYSLGDIVEPTAPNGFAYQAIRNGSPYPSWKPNVTRTIGDIVEPTTYNGFFYTVIDTVGLNPQSGATEPTWPTSDGAQISEDVNGFDDSSATSTAPVTKDIPQSIQDRYG